MSDAVDGPAGEQPDPEAAAGRTSEPAWPAGMLPSWRVSPRTPALLVLVAVLAVVWNIAGQPSVRIRVVTILLAVVCLAMAWMQRRAHLIVEPEGVRIRYVRHEEFVGWSEVVAIEVMSAVRGVSTVRFRCDDGSHVDVPPAVFGQNRKESRTVAARRIEQVAVLLREYWKAAGGRAAA